MVGELNFWIFSLKTPNLLINWVIRSMAKIFNFKHENKCHLGSCYFQIKHLKFKFHLLPTIYKKKFIKKKINFRLPLTPNYLYLYLCLFPCRISPFMTWQNSASTLFSCGHHPLPPKHPSLSLSLSTP